MIFLNTIADRWAQFKETTHHICCPNPREVLNKINHVVFGVSIGCTSFLGTDAFIREKENEFIEYQIGSVILFISYWGSRYCILRCSQKANAQQSETALKVVARTFPWFGLVCLGSGSAIAAGKALYDSIYCQNNENAKETRKARILEESECALILDECRNITADYRNYFRINMTTPTKDPSIHEFEVWCKLYEMGYNQNTGQNYTEYEYSFDFVEDRTHICDKMIPANQECEELIYTEVSAGTTYWDNNATNPLLLTNETVQLINQLFDRFKQIESSCNATIVPTIPLTNLVSVCPLDQKRIITLFSTSIALSALSGLGQFTTSLCLKRNHMSKLSGIEGGKSLIEYKRLSEDYDSDDEEFNPDEKADPNKFMIIPSPDSLEKSNSEEE